MSTIIFNLLQFIYQVEPAPVASEDVPETARRSSRQKTTPEMKKSSTPASSGLADASPANMQVTTYVCIDWFLSGYITLVNH